MLVKPSAHVLGPRILLAPAVASRLSPAVGPALQIPFQAKTRSGIRLQPRRPFLPWPSLPLTLPYTFPTNTHLERGDVGQVAASGDVEPAPFEELEGLGEEQVDLRTSARVGRAREGANGQTRPTSGRAASQGRETEIIMIKIRNASRANY